MNNNKQIYLGVNIDHVATLRQARFTRYPDPIQAALIAEEAGADGITVHLREDRRHIQQRDVELLSQTIQTRLNLEMAVTDEMLAYAKTIKPAHVCLVPEKRQELTTEGGLDVLGQLERIKLFTDELQALGIEVSLFIDADDKQIDAAIHTGAKAIEIHTGQYADAKNQTEMALELNRIQAAARKAYSAGIIVNGGHGLHYHNTAAIAAIPEMNELNIGHSIICRAVMTGLKEAVSSMKNIMLQAR